MLNERPPAFPVHPGGTLSDAIQDRGTTLERLSNEANIPANVIVGILAEQTPITASIAHRLARYFGTSPEFWMELQVRYDLDTAALDPRLDAIVPLPAPEGE